MTTTEKKLKVHIRWMIRRDMAEVLDIERQCFEAPWTEDNFLACLRQRNCVGMVAEAGDDIVGFVLYSTTKHRIQMLDLAVLPNYRRRDIGSQLIAKLLGKLSGTTRLKSSGLTAMVRDTNLQAQLFFRDSGFRAVESIRDYYDNGESAIRMDFAPS